MWFRGPAHFGLSLLHWPSGHLTCSPVLNLSQFPEGPPLAPSLVPPDLGNCSPLSLTLAPYLSLPLPLPPSMPLYLTLLHLTLDFTNSNMTFLIFPRLCQGPSHRFPVPHVRVHLIIAIITRQCNDLFVFPTRSQQPWDHALYLISLCILSIY